MKASVTAIVGAYRKGHIIDSAIDYCLESARQNGAEVNKIYLLEKNINFCTNCRKCTVEKIPGSRGKCMHDDDMNQILWQIENSDAVILGSPINFGTVTAVMKKFIERLIVYAYWPYGKQPKHRIKKTNKNALLITSSACPAVIGRILMPNSFSTMKAAARCMGAKVNGKIYFGSACTSPGQKLTEKQIDKCKRAGEKLSSGLL